MVCEHMRIAGCPNHTGFPDLPSTFHANTEAIRKAGYDVVLPTLWGYCHEESDDDSFFVTELAHKLHGLVVDAKLKVRVVDHITSSVVCPATHLINEIIVVMDANLPLQTKNIHLVGHDWGSAIVYAHSVLYPGTVQSATMIAVPPNFLLGVLAKPSQVHTMPLTLTLSSRCGIDSAVVVHAFLPAPDPAQALDDALWRGAVAVPLMVTHVEPGSE